MAQVSEPEPSKMQASILKELAGTPFASSALEPLSGGVTNFLFRAALERPLPSGDCEVLVKHGEPYVAQNPGFKLSTTRCGSEHAVLQAAAARLAPASSSRFEVRTPRPLLYHEASTTQVMEYFPNSIDLKHYCLKHFATTPTPERFRPLCRDLGRTLGLWLRSFHDWAQLPEQAQLLQTYKQNADWRTLKVLINQGWTVAAIDKFPAILGEVRDELEAALEAAKKEAEAAEHLQLIHGDFWTGNALLPDEPFWDEVGEGEEELTQSRKVDIFIVDWESVQVGLPALDVGQMVAELYQLTLFKKIDAGLWTIEGLLEGYGQQDDSFGFRTALQVGTHIISFGASTAGWGTPAQVEDAVTAARDMIVKARQKDRAWFDDHPLGCLFPRAAC